MLPDIYDSFEALEQEKSKKLLGFYIFTGCDQIGHFHGISKEKCWKKFMEYSKDELESFKDFGSSNILPGAGVISGLERFTMCLYISNIASTIASIGEHLLCKKQCKGENPPATLNALKFKIYRSHLVTMVFKRSTESRSNILSLLVFGLEEANGKHQPIMTSIIRARKYY